MSNIIQLLNSKENGTQILVNVLFIIP